MFMRRLDCGVRVLPEVPTFIKLFLLTQCLAHLIQHLYRADETAKASLVQVSLGFNFCRCHGDFSYQDEGLSKPCRMQ